MMEIISWECTSDRHTLLEGAVYPSKGIQCLLMVELRSHPPESAHNKKQLQLMPLTSRATATGSP